MVDPLRAFDGFKPASPELDGSAPRKIKLLVALFPFLVACLCVTLASVPAPGGPQKKYAHEYRQRFKGPPANPNDLAFVGPDAKSLVKFEPEGLRITLPSGHAKERKGTGVATGFAVRGDFEITLSFEILKEPAPDDAGPKSRLTLAANLDKPSPWLNQVALSHRIAVRGGVQNVTWMSLQEENSKKIAPMSEAFATQDKRGRFRLVREGADVSYFAAEGAAGEWKLLATYPYSAEDVRDVAVIASTGGEKASLDVRVTDLVIRAAAFPETPPVRKVDVSAEPKPSDPVADPQQPGPTPRQENRGFLIAVLIIGLVIVVVVVLTLGFVLYKRRAAAKPTVADAARSTVSFACPKCAKGLKAKAGMAGKKVKCPQCGASAPVPPSAEPEG